MASRRNTPKAASNPALGNHPVLSYVSPDIRDLLIYKRVDSKLGTYKEPAYGSAYPSKDDEYPNHKLVYVTSADANGKVKWYYAADREEQGAYNFSHVHPSGSQGGYPYYTRTYVVRREDVDHYFEGTGEATMRVVTTGSAVLSAIDEVFSVTGEQDGAPSYTSPSGYTLKKNGNTWNLVIGVLSAFDGVNGLQDVATPDLVTGWISMNDFSPQTVDITALPASGSEYLDAGAEDPDISFNPEFEGYQFTSLRIVRINDKELDSCYVLVERRFEKLCPQSGSKINNITGECEPYTIEILPKDDVGAVCSSVGADGYGTSIEPLNCDFVKKVTSKLTPFVYRTFDTNINFTWPAVLESLTAQVWTNRKADGSEGGPRYTFTPVFKRESYSGPTKAKITELWRPKPWLYAETAGGDAEPDYTLPPYTEGVSDLTDDAVWKMPQVVIMTPTPIAYSCPVFTLNVKACLHGNWIAYCDFGSSDPFWMSSTGNSIEYDATCPYTDWPESLVVSSSQSPVGGGWMMRVVEVEKPLTYDAANCPIEPSEGIPPTFPTYPPV